LKKITTILLLFSFYFVSSQTKLSVRKHEIPGNSTNGKYSAGNTQALVNQLLHDTCLDKKFSVVFYLIQDSLYSLPSATALATYSLTDMINLLNKTFSCICVSFEHCKTVIIPNYPYNKWGALETGTAVTENWFTDNTLNIYLPEEILPTRPDGVEFGYAYPFPPSPPSTVIPVNAVVVERVASMAINGSGFSGSTLLHAIGHFFGLPHTFDEINPAGVNTVVPTPPTNASPSITTLEFVDRTNIQNCLDHGDGFCDTEADPYPSSATSPTYASGARNCVNTLGLKDGHGNFYTPPCDNIMSAYEGTRCRFSQQQYNFMAYMILTRRLYLH
jgi:hypothetical protein